MKFHHLSREEVKRTNQLVYNRKSVREYEKNPSIFEAGRQQEIKNTLKEISAKTHSGNFLDIGSGTGNLIKLGKDYFQLVIGMDMATELVKQTKQLNPGLNLIVADADYPPFKNNTFNCVAFYGTLHHLFEPAQTLRNSYDLLKPNGYLYTDHDPNYFFNRFYHLYYSIRYYKQAGFGSSEEEIAEFHHTQTNGINPELLKQDLAKIGFQNVNIYYRQTSNPRLSRLSLFFLVILKIFSYLIPLRSFYTHFYLIARK